MFVLECRLGEPRLLLAPSFVKPGIVYVVVVWSWQKYYFVDMNSYRVKSGSEQGDFFQGTPCIRPWRLGFSMTAMGMKLLLHFMHTSHP